MPTSWRRRVLLAGTVLSPLAILPALWLGSQRRPPTEPQAVAAPPVKQTPPEDAKTPREPDRVEQVVLSQKKRIMGRKKSLLYVRRIVEEIAPLVERALEQPSIQEDLKALATEMGLTLPAFKEYFKRKQEADLLLESGGDPNARSVANAIGVAQWLASTGRSQGLRIDLAASRQLTVKIDRLIADLEMLEAQPPSFARAAPAWWKEPSPARTTPAMQAERKTKAQAGKTLSDPAPPAGEAPPAAAGELSTPETTATTPASAPTHAAGPPSPPAAAATPTDGASAPVELAPSNAAPAPLGQDVSIPSATTRPAPSAAPSRPEWTRDRWINYRKWEIRRLQAKRRKVDERYDPEKAIAAQTRYLVRLARRYGSVDWALKAYHGGEAGVARTVAYYLGDRRRQFASTEGAIRGVLPSRGGGVTRVRPPLSYADLYFGITPRTHPDAFGYLYGRSDDHRYYWWKVLMAERAIALYRRDPEEFKRQWLALRPGQRMEVTWYPRHEELTFRDVPALSRGYAEGKLVRLPADFRARGLELSNVAPLDAANAYYYKGLRPEAMGALLQLAALYRRHGGKAPLRIISLTQTEQYAALLAARYPTPPPKEPVAPEDFPIDLHPTGLTFDLQQPAAGWDRKVLEYALGLLSDRGRIYWLIERERGPARYHVCPNPKYAKSLARALEDRNG